MEPCKLCASEPSLPAGHAAGRPLLRCARCGLVFAPRSCWLDLAAERERYALHDNTIANAGYVSFLTEVADVVSTLVPAGGRVLDFGSGPAAVLTAVLRERGVDCVAYDPLYEMGAGALRGDGRFDVVVLCEVIEHLRDLAGELRRIARVLAERGSVVVRTRLRPAVEELPRWWYVRDPTHINFLAEETLPVVAMGLGCSVEARPLADVVVFRRRQ